MAAKQQAKKKPEAPPPAPPSSGRRIEYMPLGEVQGAEQNPKLHADNDIADSIGRFGYAEPVLLDERTQRLVAGHGRMTALRVKKESGEKPPDGIRVKGGEWLVPVVRGWASRSDSDAKAYLLASNQLTIRGGWDNNPLAEMLKELAAQDGGLVGVGFGDAELSKLLDGIAANAPADEDDVPHAPKKSYVEPGDMYQLGDHVILCGSSLDAATVDRLMQGQLADICWTDPPWNVAYDGKDGIHRGKKRSEQHTPIANDNLGEDFPQFCAQFSGEIARVLKPGAPLYVAMSAQEWPTIHAALTSMGFHWSSTIIWAKDSLVLSRKDYHTQYEPIWYGWKEGGARLVEIEDRTQSDLWAIPRPKKSDEHPTMKPVELVKRALLNSSRRDALVYEPFSGSGTTLMACELTGRRCRAVELEPKYVQVAIERWEAHSKGKAEKL